MAIYEHLYIENQRFIIYFAELKVTRIDWVMGFIKNLNYMMSQFENQNLSYPTASVPSLHAR